jgi:hypothetical protein
MALRRSTQRGGLGDSGVLPPRSTLANNFHPLLPRFLPNRNGKSLSIPTASHPSRILAKDEAHFKAPKRESSRSDFRSMAGTLAPDQSLDAGEFHAIAASGVLVQGESSIQRFVSPSEEQEARSLQIFQGHQVRQQNPGRSSPAVHRRRTKV